MRIPSLLLYEAVLKRNRGSREAQKALREARRKLKGSKGK